MDYVFVLVPQANPATAGMSLRAGEVLRLALPAEFKRNAAVALACTLRLMVNMPSSRPESFADSGSAALAPTPGMLRLMLRPRIVLGAIKVSVVLGTVLNVINNGEQLWTHHAVNLWQVAMNFVAPYCVSSYSGARNEAQRGRGD